MGFWKTLKTAFTKEQNTHPTSYDLGNPTQDDPNDNFFKSETKNKRKIDEHYDEFMEQVWNEEF